MDDGETVVLKDAYVSGGNIVGTDSSGETAVVALSSIKTVEARSPRAWTPVLAATIFATVFTIYMIAGGPLF